MTITPLRNTIYLKIDSPKVGDLDMASRDTAVEYAEVISVGDGVTSLKKGDRVFVKAWAVDIVQHEDKKYYFCNLDTNGILAIIKK